MKDSSDVDGSGQLAADVVAGIARPDVLLNPPFVVDWADDDGRHRVAARSLEDLLDRLKTLRNDSVRDLTVRGAK